MDPSSEEPIVNMCGTIKDAYQKWLNNHMTVRCIVRVVMNDEFSHKFKNA